MKFANTKYRYKETNKCLFLASVGLTIKRAVLLAPWAGSFLLSSLFAYFFDNEKSKKKKREKILMIEEDKKEKIIIVGKENKVTNFYYL